MSESPSVPDSSYLTCEINGSQYILQTVPSSPEAFINIENLENDSVAFVEPPKVTPDEPTQPNDEQDQTIPLVCLDGQIYAVQNGQLQELNISRLQEESFELQTPKNLQKCERNEAETPRPPAEASQVKRNELISEKSVEPKTLQEKEDLNANDFLEVVTAFKCKVCPYTTQDRSELLAHFKTNHTTSPSSLPKSDSNSKIDDVKLLYMCGECSNCFPTIESCREHMIRDHQLTDRVDTHQKAPIIERPEVPKKSLKTQNTKRRIEVKDKNIKCWYRGCLHKFTTEEMMQKHAACHVESQTQNSFKCTICPDTKFVKWKLCSMHLWKKHQIDIDLLSCDICKNYKSATMVKLSTHMRVHSDNRDFECSDCGKRFKQSSQLRNHRVMHLDRKSVEIERWYTSKTCEMCGKTYADSKCLKNHMQAVHSKLRPYVCNVCGHSSARKAMLQMHLRQHTGDKPFNCDICEFRTGDHNSLRRHVMRHTGVRPYKCPHCSYSAIQSSSYKNHLKAKHPTSSGLFTCQLCPFKTVKRESFVEHVGDHEKGLIKSTVQKKEREKDSNNVEVFPGNIAAAQLIYSCLGAFSKVGKTIEASLMSSSTSADGTSQTITIQIPSKHLEGSLPMTDNSIKNSSTIEQDDDETMHCFLKIPHEEEEDIDTGGITIPAEPEDNEPQILNVES